MSIQALLYRMKDLDVIAETQYKHWCMDISAQGWRKNEPGAIPREEPQWFRRALLQAVTENWLTKEQAELMSGETLQAEEPLTLILRRSFMKLSLDERRQIMAKQAKELTQYYNDSKDLDEDGESDFIL